MRHGRGWIIATALSTLLVCSAVATAYSLQARRAAQSAVTSLALRQAANDVHEAFHHVTLSGHPDSPWQRAQGEALLRRAADTLRRVAQTPGEVARVDALLGAVELGC